MRSFTDFMSMVFQIFQEKRKMFFFQCCKYIRLNNLDPNKKVKYKVKGKER